jgi:hypothetical protein
MRWRAFSLLLNPLYYYVHEQFKVYIQINWIEYTHFKTEWFSVRLVVCSQKCVSTFSFVICRC